MSGVADKMKVFKYKETWIGMRKLLMVSFMFLFMISVVVAETDTPKIRTNFDLKIPFEVNGSAASTSATCNVTLIYPNNTAVFSNNSATNNDNGIFNITFTESQNTVLGWHNWIAFCCDSSDCASGYGDFKVTTTGGDRGFSLFLVLIISAMVLFILSFVAGPGL